MWIEVNAVPWPSAKLKHRLTFEIEESSLRRHEAINHTELGALRTPFHTVDWAFFACIKIFHKHQSWKYVHLCIK
jgi:hypothetical protein